MAFMFSDIFEVIPEPKTTKKVLLLEDKRTSNTMDKTKRKCCPQAHCRNLHIHYNINKKSYKCYKCHHIFTKPGTRHVQPMKAHRKKRSAHEQETPTKAEIVHKINMITSPRDKAFIATLYLSACRVSELIPYKTYPGLRKIDIEAKKIKNKKNEDVTFLLLHNRPILKRKNTPRKTIPINVSREKNMVKALYDYIMMPSVDPAMPLFEFTRYRAYQIVRDTMGEEYYTHWFRHIRTTHLITMDGLNETQLVKYLGHADNRQLKHYAHLRWQDLAASLAD